jgi:hypothetical protein
MTTAELLENLNYTDSPNFFSVEAKRGFDDAADFAHVFRRANVKLSLKGVYTLRQSVEDVRDNIIPVVYVCEVDSESEASKVHRQVWNQNIVPFLIVVSPETIRLHSGFRFEKDGSLKQQGILKVAKDMNSALDALEAFHSERIDDGTVWEQWGDSVTPETRVDWKLLSHLNDLDRWLRDNGLADPKVSHALIGKYVYLRYLRDRDILSDRRLEEWGVSQDQIFGRHATLTAFWHVVEELDTWLNGSMFPLPKHGENRPRIEHVQKVAGTFAGDDPHSGQLSLDFDVYDFSFIPIETLSVIYEQFLHAPNPDGSPTKGKSQGAYYTPIPVVNFMLEELDALHPFQHGMKVLDPACGSGAFLVQCYRRIIEQDEEFDAGKAMRPARLRTLLEEHVFGIDRDLDACRVAEFSLSLTLLDYVDPPDLMRYSTFQLPSLHHENIFHGDFFDPDAVWRSALTDVKFDWIVGNPPWVELKKNKIEADDQHAWHWLQDSENKKLRPTGGNQVSEAFAWEVTKWSVEDGRIALLLPAMTLFKNESESFRARMLSEFQFECVANFANFSDVLFPGHRYRDGKHIATKRPTRPAIAIFYCAARNNDSVVPVYSPFVADHDSSRSQQPNKQKDAWNIAIDSCRISYLDPRDIADGDGLHWKAAMWGSHHDVRLLRRIEKAFEKETLLDRCRVAELDITEGLQLRKNDGREEVEEVPELAGKLKLEMSKLKNCGRIFVFPESSLSEIDAAESFVRKGRAKLPLIVSKPPHVIVDKARRFAVYDERFIAVPPRQIGIAGTERSQSLLKALSLFVVSDFSIYHQFFFTPEWGISTSISTLETLKRLPLPFGSIDSTELEEWESLHSRLIKGDLEKIPLLEDNVDDTPLRAELNERVYKLLRLAKHECCLISDLVDVRMQLLRGKVAADAIREPNPDELLAYCRMLRDELDAFVDDQPSLKHRVTVSKNGRSAVLAIELLTNERRKQQPKITDIDDTTASEFAKIRSKVRKKHSQWFYFNRNLRMYEGHTTYIFKPLSRLHWLESQALQDASTIIAETLS